VNTGQIREYVIRPALQRIGMWDEAGEQLVYGTGLVETGYNCIDQLTPGPGPAYGPWQMEEPTHYDIWTNFLPGQSANLRQSLLQMAGFGAEVSPPVTALHGNWFYAAAMCRIRYRRVPAPLPAPGDASAMAAYWKQWYNTPKGAGTIERALPLFQQAVAA